MTRWVLLLVMTFPAAYCLWTFLLTSLLGGRAERMLSARGLRALGREAALQYLLWGLAVRDLLLPPSGTGTDGGGPVVVLVPGFTETESLFLPLRRVLERRGCACRAFRFDSLRCDPEQEAARLGSFARFLGAAYPDRSLVLMGHSLGALLAARAAAGLSGNKPPLLIALGAPWRGTLLAHLAPRRCGRNLVPGGEFMSGVTPPSGPGVLNVRSVHDTMQAPFDSSVLDGVEELVVDDGWGHNSLVWNPRVVEGVVDWIQAHA